MINWQMITDGYNLTHGRKFKPKEMFGYLYSHMGNMQKISDYLGVSVTALCRKMDLLNVPRERRTLWPASIPSKIAGIPDAKLAKMTTRDVAKLFGCHISSAYRALDLDGRKYSKRNMD